MKDYKKILEGVVNIINTTEKSDIGFTNICTYIGENCPELKESEDERIRIRKALIDYFKWNAQQILNDFDNNEVLVWLEKQGEQKPAWSEEDEKYVKDLVAYFTGGLSLKHSEEDIVNWLKDLENRVQPKPKQEWSEEDEDNFKHLMNEIAKIIKNEDRV